MTVILTGEPTASAPALRLRPWRGEDAETLVMAHRDSLLRRWLTTPLINEADARRWIDEQSEGWAAGTRLSFAVLECYSVDSDVSRPVGNIVVKGGVATAESSAEVGYWTSAEVRGRGVAPRALEAVSRWTLGSQHVMPLARLDLLHAADNHASCRVAEKCRYVLSSVLPARLPRLPNGGSPARKDERRRLNLRAISSSHRR